MRFTETITIPWRSISDEKPDHSRAVWVKPRDTDTFSRNLVYIPENPAYKPYYGNNRVWVYADEVAHLETDGAIVSNVPIITQDSVKVFTVFAIHYFVDCDINNPIKRVNATITLKDGTVIPFDVPYFKDKKEICHPHRFIYNGNAYVIDILPNSPHFSHDFYRAVIRRCWGEKHPIYLNGYIATF